jgi:uncharacterized delta-60 repeat protein
MLLGNGKAVLAGSSYNGFDWDIFFRRYNIDGSPDTTFGTGGIALYDTAGAARCTSAAVQPDGKILVAGSVWENGGLGDALLLRYE